MQYEYKTLSYTASKVFGGPAKAGEYEYDLNRLGSQGWELVTCLNSSVFTGYVVALFKRPVPTG